MCSICCCCWCARRGKDCCALKLKFGLDLYAVLGWSSVMKSFSLACCRVSGGKDGCAELEVGKNLGNRLGRYWWRLCRPPEFPWSGEDAVAVSRFVSLFGWSLFVWSWPNGRVSSWVNTSSFHDGWMPRSLLEEISFPEGVALCWREGVGTAYDLREGWRFTNARSWQRHWKPSERQWGFWQVLEWQSSFGNKGNKGLVPRANTSWKVCDEKSLKQEVFE